MGLEFSGGCQFRRSSHGNLALLADIEYLTLSVTRRLNIVKILPMDPYGDREWQTRCEAP
ncbi:hypothetical protein BCA33_02940 [Marinobacter sp. AC-23]|nr:hypothetical protein BCA33_02940 [Marinobacter sp. AC-23]